MNNLALKVTIGEKEKAQPKMHLLHRGRHGRNSKNGNSSFIYEHPSPPLYLGLMEKSPSPPQNQYRWRSPLSLHRILVKHGLTDLPYMASPKWNPHRRAPNRIQSNLNQTEYKVYLVVLYLPFNQNLIIGSVLKKKKRRKNWNKELKIGREWPSPLTPHITGNNK